MIELVLLAIVSVVALPVVGLGLIVLFSRPPP